MLVVRHGQINDVHLSICQQFVISPSYLFAGGNAPKPVPYILDQICHSHQFWLHLHVR